MTSNGNTAQKHLIKILTETHQESKTAYKQAIETAPNKETADAIKRIYTKLILTYDTQTAETFKNIFDVATPQETAKTFNKKVIF